MRLPSFRDTPVHLLAAAVFAAGLLLSTAAAWWQARANNRLLDSEMAARARQISSRLADGFQLYQYGLRGARGAVVTAGETGLTHALFQRYSATRDVDSEFPGALGFGFIRRVAPGDEARFVAQARRDGQSGFTLHDLGRHDGERYVIQYIEPLARNRQAVGLDIGSEARRRAAAYDALVSGQPRITAPITLVQASGDRHQGFLLLMPIYRTGNTPATPAGRLASGYGWSYAPLNINRVLQRQTLDAEVLHLELSDVTDPAHPQRFYATPGDGRPEPPRLFTQRIEREVFGRRWAIVASAHPPFVARMHLLSPTSVFATGALVSLLAALLTGAQIAGSRRRKQAAIEKAHLAAIVESANDAVIGITPDGRIASWNHAAERIFGYPAADALGRPLTSLIVPEAAQEEEARLLERVARGATIAPFDTQRRRHDGALLDVAVTVSPVRDEEGRLVGLSKTMRDISDKKAAESRILELNATLEAQVAARTAELEAARRDLQTVLDAVPSTIGYWDRHLVNRVANRTYLTWFGHDPATLPGKHIREVLGETLYQANLAQMEAALRGESRVFEFDLERPDGSGTRRLLAHFIPDQVGDEVLGFYSIVHDITEITESRQRLALALQENQVLLRTINEQMLYSVTDAAGNITDVNDNFCRISGYRRDELIGRNHRLINSGHHPREFWESMWSTVAAGQSWHGEICNRAKDGGLYWVDSVIAPFIGADGVIERYVSLRSDITYRKEAEAELDRVHSLLGSVLRAASEVAIIATDPEGVIQIFNSGAERMLGYRAEELVGRRTPALIHLPEEIAARGAELSARYHLPIEGFRVFVHVPELEGSESRQWTYVRRDGSQLQVSLVATTMRNAEGRITGYLGIAEDITERLRAGEALRQAKDAAEAANVAKSLFLANVSHEIRTPMNAVIGIAHLLDGTPLDPDQRQLLAKLQIAGRSLLGIINDVLDLAKIEAGEMRLDPAPFAPAALFDELLALFQPQAAAKGLMFAVSGGSRVPAGLVGDAPRLRQILTNLVGNALKFTEHGSITLEAGSRPAGPGRVWLELAVRDTGCGIPPEALSRLFTPFSQADASITRHYGGTGLGLSIVHRLVTLMGGEVDVTSAPGLGSAFRVRLPFDLANHLRPDPATLLEVQIVDDDETDRAALLRMCRSLGWRAQGYPDGEALLREFDRRLASGQALPDALLVDWQLGDLDGLDGLQVLERLAGRTGRERLPASLIISAHEHSAIAQRDHARMVDQILTKPVDSSELFNAVNTSLARHTGTTRRVLEATTLDAIATGWLPGVRILLVDDSEINLEVARRLLEREGARVRTCANGREAVDALRADPAGVDIVLMDVQMPVLDGYAATRELRALPGLERVPVLALTAGALEEERRRAEASGMDGFLTKPLDPAQMVRAVRHAIENATGRPWPVHAPANAPAPPPDWPAIDGVDLAGAKNRTGDDPDFYYAQFERFLDEYHDVADPTGLRATLHSAPKALAARMHKLRGVAGLLGASRMHPLAGEIELALNAGGEAEQIAGRLDELAGHMRTLTAAAAPVLAARRAAARRDQDSAAPVDGYALRALAAHLRLHDFAAVELFRDVAPGLRGLLDAAAYEDLRKAVDSLDFDLALSLLEPLIERQPADHGSTR